MQGASFSDARIASFSVSDVSDRLLSEVALSAFWLCLCKVMNKISEDTRPSILYKRCVACQHLGKRFHHIGGLLMPKRRADSVLPVQSSDEAFFYGSCALLARSRQSRGLPTP